MGTLSTSTPRMRVLVIFCALVSIAIAGAKGKGGKGRKDGKDGKNGKGGKGGNGGKSKGEESMATMMGGKDEMMQEKMDAALKQCVPPEMMAATMEDMQDPSTIASDIKILSSGRSFTFDEPSERRKEKSNSKSNPKNSKKKSKKSKKSK